MSSIGYNAGVKATFGYNDLKDLVMDSTYNRGELRLNSKGKLETINSHVSMTWKNHEVTSREENARVRSAVYNSIAAHANQAAGQSDDKKSVVRQFLSAVRQSLFADGVAGESLSRDEVRFLMSCESKMENLEDIPLTSRKIQAVKLAEKDYSKNPEGLNFLKDNIKGYDVSAKKNDVVLGVTDNKKADKAWRQSLATAKSNAARMIDAYEWLSASAKTVLRNHVELGLEETWSQARSEKELPDEKAVRGKVREALNDDHFVSVLSTVDYMAKQRPIAMGQLLRSGIDLLTTIPPEMENKNARLGYLSHLAHGLGALVPLKGKANPRDLCNALLERAGEMATWLLNGADPSTMTRSKLLETCVELLKVKDIEQHADALSVDKVLNAGKNLGKEQKTFLEKVLDSDEGNIFLDVMNDSATIGREKSPETVLQLLQKMAGAFPNNVDPETKIAELRGALKTIAGYLASSDPSVLASFAQDDIVMGNIARAFSILFHDKSRMESDLAEMKTFLSKQVGANWNQIKTLSNYMNGLEKQAQERPTIGSVIFQEFKFDSPEWSAQMQAPVLKFKLEQLKQVILSLKKNSSVQIGEKAMGIVAGENLSVADKAILQKASGQALLEAFESDKDALPELSYPRYLQADQREQLKRILQPAAEKAFQDAPPIKNFADLEKTWETFLGKPPDQNKCHPGFAKWMSEYLSFMDKEMEGVFSPEKGNDAVEWKQIADSCVTLGIDPTALHLSEISKTNSHLVGPFLQAVLSQKDTGFAGTLLNLASEGLLVEALNVVISQIEELEPEDFGLEIANAAERKLFDSLKWMLPLDCLDLFDPNSPLANRSIVKIFNELKQTVAELAETNLEGRTPQEIAKFRGQLMENLVSDYRGRTLFRTIQRQLADEADLQKVHKFTVSGWLKPKLEELSKVQKNLDNLVTKFEKEYGGLLLLESSQNLRDGILNLAGTGKDVLDRSQNFNWRDNVEPMKKAISRLEDRLKVLEYTMKLADDPKYAGKQNLVLAAARIVATSDKGAFSDTKGVDALLKILEDWTKNQQIKELSEQLDKQLAGMPDTKAEVLQTLKDIFTTVASAIDLAVSDENATAIFGANFDFGADGVTGFAKNLVYEMLNVDQKLIYRVAAANADADLKDSIGDFLMGGQARVHKEFSVWGAIGANEKLEGWVAKHGLGGGESADRIMDFIRTKVKPGEQGKSLATFAEFVDIVEQTFRKDGLAVGEDRTAVRAWITKQMALVVDDVREAPTLVSNLSSTVGLKATYLGLLRMAKRYEEELAAFQKEHPKDADHPNGLTLFMQPSQPSSFPDLMLNRGYWSMRLLLWKAELNSMLDAIDKLKDVNLRARLTGVLLYGTPLSDLNETDAAMFKGMMQKAQDAALLQKLHADSSEFMEDELSYDGCVPPNFTEKGREAIKTLVFRLWGGRTNCSPHEYGALQKEMRSYKRNLNAFARGAGEDFIIRVANAGLDFKTFARPDHFELFYEYGIFIAKTFEGRKVDDQTLKTVMQNPKALVEESKIDTRKVKDYFPSGAGELLPIHENVFERLQLLLWQDDKRLKKCVEVLCLAVNRLLDDQEWKGMLFSNELKNPAVSLEKVLFNHPEKTDNLLNALDKGVDSFVQVVKTGFKKRYDTVKTILDEKYEAHVNKCLQYMGLDPEGDKERWNLEKKKLYRGNGGTEIPNGAFGLDLSSLRLNPYLDTYDDGTALQTKIRDRITAYDQMMDDFADYLEKSNFDSEVKTAAKRMIAVSQHDRFPNLEMAKTYVQTLQTLRNDQDLAAKLTKLAKEKPKDPQSTFELVLLLSEKCAEMKKKLPEASFNGDDKTKAVMADLVWCAVVSNPDLALQFGDRCLNGDHFQQLRLLESSYQEAHETDATRLNAVGVVLNLLEDKETELTVLYNRSRESHVLV